MKLTNYLCEICLSDKNKNEVLLVQINFKENPRRIEKSVDDWYTGIRVVCKTCAKRLGELFTEDCSDVTRY